MNVPTDITSAASDEQIIRCAGALRYGYRFSLKAARRFCKHLGLDKRQTALLIAQFKN